MCRTKIALSAMPKNASTLYRDSEVSTTDKLFAMAILLSISNTRDYIVALVAE